MLTFIDDRYLEWDADDANQVLHWYQRTQDGPDSQSLTFALIDQLYGKA